MERDVRLAAAHGQIPLDQPWDRRPPTDHATSRASRVQALNAYQQAWSAAPSPGAIEYWLTRCWRPDSCYLNPFVDPVQGVEGLAALIVDYAALFPDLRIHPVGVPVVNAHRGRCRWAMRSSRPIRILGVDFGRVMYGRDVVTFADDGRIKLAVASFDPARAANPADDQ